MRPQQRPADHRALQDHLCWRVRTVLLRVVKSTW
jgi:hypothetical protein